MGTIIYGIVFVLVAGGLIYLWAKYLRKKPEPTQRPQPNRDAQVERMEQRRRPRGDAL